MSRKPVRVIEDPQQIRPVAAPVNSYVRPADPAPSRLHQVAEGLAEFDRGMSSFLGKRREEKNKADKIRGEAAFNKANQLGWAEAVRRGLVPANASPLFQESYKRSQGNLAGIKLREKFNTEYLAWEGRNSDDPEAFDTFVSDFLVENIGTDDPYVLAGLNPHIQALTEDAYSVHGKEVASTTYNGHVSTQAALAGESIDYANQDGLETGNGTNYEGLRGDLLAQREEALKTGIRMEDYDAQLVKAIAAKAIEHQDPQLLDILDETLPGYDVNLSSLPEFRDIKQATIEKIEVGIRQRMNDNSKQQKAIDKEAEDKLIRDVFTVLDKDPTAEIPEDLIKQWEKYDPEARTKLARARNSLQDADELESREDLLMIEQMIQDGATQKDIFDLVSDGLISDPVTLKAALDRVERRRKAMLEGSGVLRTQTARRFLSTIKRRTTPEKWLSGMFLPEGLTDEGLEATRDFEVMLLQWEAENPNVSVVEREKALNEIGELVLSRIVREFPGKEEPQYVSPSDAAELERQIEPHNQNKGQSPSGGVSNQDTNDSSTTTSSSERPSKSFWSLPTKEEFNKAMKIDSGIRIPREKDVEGRRAWERSQIKEHFSGDQPPTFSDLDPVFQDKLRANAEALGMDPEEFIKEFWKKLNSKANEAPEPEKTNPQVETVEDNLVKSSLTTGEVEGEVSKTIESAIIAGTTKTVGAALHREVHRASTLLDLIGNTEGTDKGDGYNETLAYGAYTGGDVDLVNMTLGDLDKLQTSMLRHPKNKWNSSAVGRYQIVRTTLRKLKKKMRLTDDMKFTEELQDLMAIELLKGRGLQAWLAGLKSDKSFVNALAREWASLPTSAGKGYYGGQHAGTSVQGVLTALSGVKGFKDDLTNVAEVPQKKPQVSS